MLSFVSVPLQLGVLAVVLAVVVPLAGALVRFRAQRSPTRPRGRRTTPYGPSGRLLHCHVDEGVQNRGLFKGCMPPILQLSIVALIELSLSTSSLRDWNYTISLASVPRTLVYRLLLYTLVSLPWRIITDRAIITPHKLPYFNAMYSLRILLTPTERRRPWILYLTPGLLVTQVYRITYETLWPIAVRLLLPELRWRSISFGDISAIRVAILFVLALANTVVLTPVDVIATRLAIQRNYAASELNSVSQEEEDDAEEAAEYVGIDEDVISLRTEQEPYTGLVDCARRIVDEEGWSALYRAWWLTTLGCLHYGVFNT